MENESEAKKSEKPSRAHTDITGTGRDENWNSIRLMPKTHVTHNTTTANRLKTEKASTTV